MSGRDCPVIIRGTLYASQRAAARALGVRLNTLRAAIERGTVDRVGMRQSGVVYDGAHYPSQAAAAEAHGVTQSAISKRLRRQA